VAALTQQALAQTAASESDSSAATLNEVVVTGNRGQPRTVTSSPAPIDVINAQQLQQLSGSGQIRDVLSQLLPSFQAQQWVGSSSWNSVVRPAGLRGLGGADVLVLVNGKRRHNSAQLDLSTGNLNNGANPVDLDLIPDAAIDHIEVLRDGASAQYGSDAIAGVINIILKQKDDGGTLSANGGQRYRQDGATYRLDGSVSFALPNEGSTTLAMSLKDQERATRAAQATGAFYFPVNGAADPRDATVDRYVYKGGLPKNQMPLFSENTEMQFGDVTLYNTGTFALRKAWVGQAFRRPNSTNDILDVYPDGYSPFYTLHEIDFQDTQGGRGTWGEWHWDLSTTYGRDQADNGSEDSLNASLGSASPTTFDTFSAVFEQLTTNADLTRAVDIGGRSLMTSFGLEHRYERYSTRARDPAAYIDGGYIYASGPLKGQHAVVGAQGAIIVTPSDEAQLSRNSESGYVDFDYNVTDKWLVALAGRFEHYDDSAGNTTGGKFSTRYELTPQLAFRATVSNGFRAPSLPQEGFAQTSAQYALVSGGYRFIQSKTMTVDSPVSRALGATPLKPETSRNYSAGVTFTPTRAFTATLDAYQINLDDRVALTGYLSGAGVSAILAANGFATNQYVRYFANAIDTRTRGFDLVGTWAQELGNFGNLKLSLGFNQNKTAITHVRDTPTQLAGLGLTLFDRASQGGVTVANPHTKAVVGENWTHGAWSVDLRQTRYGAVDYLNNNPTLDQHYGAKWLADISVGWNATPAITVSAGAENVFNLYPDRNTVADTNGLSPYATISPFGYYGGFYYARVNFKF
jgi:iron complex outermembrane receptor protein